MLIWVHAKIYAEWEHNPYELRWEIIYTSSSRTVVFNRERTPPQGDINKFPWGSKTLYALQHGKFDQYIYQ